MSQLDTFQRELVFLRDSSELTAALLGLNVVGARELYWQITPDYFFF